MWLELLKSSLSENFGEKLRDTIAKLGKNIKEFSEESGIPKSTLYKIVSNEEKDFRRSTLRQIVETVKRLEGYNGEKVIGIITTRGALDTIGRSFEFGGKVVKVNEYPATTIEEEIIQGIRAEKEGVRGLICGPIAATTLEKVVDIPIVALRFEEGPLINSLKKLMEKI
jgi:predicted transcriptional regulator